MPLPATISLCCPNCQATPEEGFSAQKYRCHRCNGEFFELSGMPCLFAAGHIQREFWQHLLARFIEISELSKKQNLIDLAQIGLNKLTRKRLFEQQQTRENRQQSIIKTLIQAGIKPKKKSQYGDIEPKGLTQYYDYILRDWAWRAPDSRSSESYRSYEDENKLSLEKCSEAIKRIDDQTIQSVLVLGSGAGRLSWDLHCLIEPEQTIAIDNNPLLAYVSHAMVSGISLVDFHEERVCPHNGIPSSHSWSLNRPTTSQNTGDRFTVIAADAWQLPFQEDQFDLVITPWFIDVCGKDVKTLQGHINRLLKPSGYWLNHGPLLYLEDTPSSQRYTPEEIREINKVGKFELLCEQFDTLPYSHSPMSERGRVEDCWTFLTKAAADKSHLTQSGNWQTATETHPDWVFLPYLPIPDLRNKNLFPEELKNIELLIDGSRSIEDLKQFFVGKLPAGHEPGQFVDGLLKDFILRH